MTGVSITRPRQVLRRASRVLQNIDLEVDLGEFIVLLGPSGCGKSTLLDAIAGLDDIDSGRHRHRRTRRHRRASRRTAASPWCSSPTRSTRTMSVRGNLTFGLESRGMPARDEIDARVAAAAQMLQIDPLLDRKPGQLSGGQRQRVAIGRALVRDAERVPVRRAAVQSRRQAARRDARRDQAAASGARQHHRSTSPTTRSRR